MLAISLFSTPSFVHSPTHNYAYAVKNNKLQGAPLSSVLGFPGLNQSDLKRSSELMPVRSLARFFFALSKALRGLRTNVTRMSRKPLSLGSESVTALF